MAVDNKMPTQVRRGKAITVRTHSRHAHVDTSKYMLVDESEPEKDDLAELEEEEEEETPQKQGDDSEELEMWMRQTRRAHLLTPAQEEHLAKQVQAKELAEQGRWDKVAELRHMARSHRFNDFERKDVMKQGVLAKKQRGISCDLPTLLKLLCPQAIWTKHFPLCREDSALPITTQPQQRQRISPRQVFAILLMTCC